ncbi:uncharacterized protein CLUP02_05850 [Colletotrichum lupini]|uniref:Uncharacterized protein n=1 Tax=Colletotrichum lupini TaxID=145971 RepID=A0A9Q8SN03_9PEZI|nr:uncharacterized protein CLUP02_05850 [Colletotrichum lupini]UQC80367.1 hypothetical protein CLUP02_05850 [Colletotrichum lupini]
MRAEEASQEVGEQASHEEKQTSKKNDRVDSLSGVDFHQELIATDKIQIMLHPEDQNRRIEITRITLARKEAPQAGPEVWTDPLRSKLLANHSTVSELDLFREKSSSLAPVDWTTAPLPHAAIFNSIANCLL